MRKQKFAALILSAVLLCGCANVTENVSEPQYSTSGAAQSDISSAAESSPAADSSTQSPASSKADPQSSPESSSSSLSLSGLSSEPETVSSSSESTSAESGSAVSSSSAVSSGSSVISKPESSSSSSAKPPAGSGSSSSKSSSKSSSSKKKDPLDSPASIRSVLNNYKSKFYYSTLNSRQKTAYERMFKAAENFEDRPDLSDLGLDEEQETEASFALKYDNPQFFYLGNYSKMTYTMDRDEARKMKPKLEAAAMKIVNKAVAKSSVKERAKVIHDEICKMTAYQLTYSEPYGPLLYGEALCEGYGKAFAYVAQMAGIETISVTGFAGTGRHLWNMIKAGNEWVHVDVTFDDQNSGTSYEYFCVGDDYIGYDHLPDSEYLKTPSKLAGAYNEKKVKAEFDKFMAQVKSNYGKGIFETTYYPDYKPMGGFLMYAVTNMNEGVYEAGITGKSPGIMYYNDWISIQLM